jgi:hypothetical protein
MAVDLSFGGRSGGASRVVVLPAGSIVKEKGDGTCVDFLMPASSGSNTGPAPMALV